MFFKMFVVQIVLAYRTFLLWPRPDLDNKQSCTMNTWVVRYQGPECIYLGGRTSDHQHNAIALDHLLYTIRNLFFHDDDYECHPQTLGPLPNINLICPASESRKIWVRTHIFLPLGQKEIRNTVVAGKTELVEIRNIVVAGKTELVEIRNIVVAEKAEQV